MNPLIPLMLVSSLLLGCASTTQVSAGRHDQFRNALTESCRSIQAADYDAARRHLGAAASLSNSDAQASKVADLRLVLNGAEALQTGRATDAATVWMRIEDASLRRQLQTLAQAEGVDLIALSGQGDS